MRDSLYRDLMHYIEETAEVDFDTLRYDLTEAHDELNAMLKNSREVMLFGTRQDVEEMADCIEEYFKDDHER